MGRADYVGGVPIYGGIRKSDIVAYSREVEIGQRIEGGRVIQKYPDFVLIEREHNTRESILWKDLILGLYERKAWKE